MPLFHLWLFSRPKTPMNIFHWQTKPCSWQQALPACCCTGAESAGCGGCAGAARCSRESRDTARDRGSPGGSRLGKRSFDNFLPAPRHPPLASSFLSLVCYCPLVSMEGDSLWLAFPSFVFRDFSKTNCSEVFVWLITMDFNTIIYLGFNIRLYSALCYVGNKNLCSAIGS